jgi:hypothetical protein
MSAVVGATTGAAVGWRIGAGEAIGLGEAATGLGAGLGEAGLGLMAGLGLGLRAGLGLAGVVAAGLTSLLQSRPMTLPGAWYWQTYVGQEQPVLTAQPSLVVDLHTRAVKWPVAVFHPGLLKLYSFTSLYQPSMASLRLA